MKSSQKLLLGATLVFFSATLVFYLLNLDVFMLVCFLLQGVFAGVFSIQSIPKRDYEAELAELNEEFEEYKSNALSNEDNLRNEIIKNERLASERSAEIENLLKKEDEFQKKIDSQSDEIETLKQEKKNKKAEVWENFLPPVEGEDVSEVIDIVDVCRETVEELTPFAKKANISVNITAPEEKLWVKANTERLRIMFRNIVDNSIKYMNKSGTLVITISNIGSDIFIVLKDTGEGLDSDETEHIFELNYQGSNRISGNGLGLTQAKAIVTYYGGTIYAKSKLGSGMGVYIQLPTV